MLKRGNALAALLRDPYTALLLTSFPAVRYYAGKEAAEGSALLAWSGGCILLPSFSSEKKKRVCPDPPRPSENGFHFGGRTFCPDRGGLDGASGCAADCVPF